MAREAVVDRMVDGVIVLDEEGRVIEGVLGAIAVGVMPGVACV